MYFTVTTILHALVSVQVALVSATPAEFPNSSGPKRLSFKAEASVRRQGGHPDGVQNAVFFTNWGIYARDYQVTDLPASEVTHVAYAFINFGPNGTLFSGDTWADVERPSATDTPANDTSLNAYGNVKQLYQLKKSNRHVKTLLSIGGWSWSTHFPAVASTSTTRANFAKSAVDYLKDWGFDGLDVDWEYPADEIQANDMILLLQAVRDELDAYAAKHANGHHFSLSIAAPASPQTIKVLKLAQLGSLLDRIYVMAYDYAGSWSNTTGHNAAVFPSKSNPNSTPFNTDQAIKLYLEGGVPASKLVLGMPLYGRAFQNTTGVGRPFNGVGPGEWEAGIYDYKSLPRGNAQIICDKKIIGCYSYEKSTQELITFDTVGVVRDKVRYAKNLGLGGSMFWEASGDKSGEESLIRASHDASRGIDETDNWLSYPESKYANIAAGLP
ncbi:hypothetical protein S7711_03634 [Stachybotrys chartarum IBT 7711]|uniref:chitinase n=1 Tax=Stachybotrys chartarum (strain CBS 109288 / IBT 7711) TaxID=1280523 RepID=A0A084AGZ1_STACB|nr:hypothetical protein S7711_03634 [Stachybotrys chartarum IBT 7711]